MMCVSATDVAIRVAHEEGKLRVVKFNGRDGEPAWAFKDAAGTIEVALSPAEVLERLTAVIGALAAIAYDVTTEAA